MRRACVTGLVVAALSCGCNDEPRLELAVDLKTDHAAGLEFSLVRTDLLRGAGGTELIEGSARELTATRARDFSGGERVAEYQDLRAGPRTVRVRLFDEAGEPVAERRTILDLERSARITAVITRDCRDVDCPGPEDAPELTACAGGRCVNPRCAPEQPASCDTPECSTDGDCSSDVTCARPRCVEGYCLLEADHDRCNSMSQWCNPDVGCRPLEVGAGSVLWAHGLASSGFDLMWNAAVDGDGKVYAVGMFAGAASFAGTDIESNGGTDGILLALDLEGRRRWHRIVGGSGSDTAFGVATGAGGGAIVAGRFEASVDFGGEMLMARPAGGPGGDGYLARYARDGAPGWVARIGGDGADAVGGVAVAPDGDIGFCGGIGQSFDFGGSPVAYAGSTDALVGSVSPSDGTAQWGAGFGDAEYQEAFAVAADTAGNLFVVGNYEGSPVVGDTTLPAPEGEELAAFVASFAPDGTPRWAVGLRADMGANAYGVATASDDVVYVAGTFAGAPAFGDGTIAWEDGVDAFVLALDATTGATRWARAFGGPGDDSAEAVTVAPDGTVVVVGGFIADLDVGGRTLEAAGEHDMFVAGLAGDGTVRYAHRVGGAGTEVAIGVAAAPDGTLVLTGRATGATRLGTFTPEPAGDNDGFVLRLMP